MTTVNGARGATTLLSPGCGTLSGQPVRGALDALVDFLREGKKPAQQVMLLTPIAITKDNLNQAERLDEVK